MPSRLHCMHVTAKEKIVRKYIISSILYKFIASVSMRNIKISNFFVVKQLLSCTRPSIVLLDLQLCTVPLMIQSCCTTSSK